MNSPIVHLCALGVLLFIGVVLRTKISIFKRYFIPASLIAGFIGLALGQYGVKVLPVEMTATFSLLPQALITIVFAPMLMGMTFPKPKEMADIAGPQLLFSYIGDFILIALPCIMTALIIVPFFNVNEMFATLAEVGFAGGHGTAGGMADVYTDLGWSEGGPLGLTVATIGLFVGLFMGMILVNYGVRKGHTSIVASTNEVGSGNAQDLLPKEAQPVAARITVNKEVVEPLAFHFALIAMAVIIGVGIRFVLESLSGLKLPLFPMAMIGGLIVQLVISKTEYADAVDSGALALLQGLALDLLIVSAIATIKVPVVIEYAAPILLISMVALAGLLFYFFYIGPRMFKTQWFEHSIVNFGALAGVTAVGLMLLRTVDPEMKSDAAKAFAMRAPFFSPIAGGGLLTSILPILIISYGALLTGMAFMGGVIVLLLLARVLGYWRR